MGPTWLGRVESRLPGFATSSSEEHHNSPKRLLSKQLNTQTHSLPIMIRQDFNRISAKRQNVSDHRKKQFADPSYKEQQYPTRLNFYSTPPTADITLEQFEQWAIDRLRSQYQKTVMSCPRLSGLANRGAWVVLAELEACSFRNKSQAETATHMKPLLEKYLPLEANSSTSTQHFAQRQKDHYSHFILRLAFSSTEDLRRRFTRVETMLFRLRLNNDDLRERAAFIHSLSLDWDIVTEEERRELASELAATSGFGRKAGSVDVESWCKVDWMRVPDLVENRKVYLKGGMAYVPAREQTSMVVAEFTKRLERALEVRSCSSVERGAQSVEQTNSANNHSSRHAHYPG